MAALQACAGVVASLLPAAAAARAQGELAEQLQWALQHRVLIEQAKGVLMEREGLSPAAAFERLRAHGPHGWAHRRRAGRCRPGRGQPAPPSGAQPDGQQGRSGVAVAVAVWRLELR